MTDPKKTLLAIISLFIFAFLALFPSPIFALNNKYYDFGSYYGQSQVLGFSFSSLDKLPGIDIPDNITPQKAEGILPGGFFYTFEKAFENIQLISTFDPVKKEELRLNIASERLAEAKTLMESGQTQAASRALNDYSNTLNTLAQNLTSLASRSDDATKELINKVEQTAAAQTVIADSLSLASPPAQAEAWTQAGQANRGLSDILSTARGESAIPEELSTSIQQLKEQGLLSEEETNKLYSFKERTQVRDEIDKLTSSGQFPLSEAIKLDSSVAKNFPDSQSQYLNNLQVVELKSYQGLPQPDSKTITELARLQNNPNLSASNDIKPYLWYNRAQNLAKEVDLTNFSQNQQTDLAKFYPQAVTDNPTYSPPPSPSPSPSASPATDDSASPSPSPSASPTSIPTPSATYVAGAFGALPGDPTYIFKQLGEGFIYTFTFDSAQKARVKSEQAEARLAEAQALSTDPKKASQYESTLRRYKSALNDASELIDDIKDPKASKLAAEKLEAQSARHEVVFEKGLLPAPSQDSKLITEIIKTTEDAMDKSADALKRPALPASLAQRLDDLKAQGLILPEEAQQLVNATSREEVREKIRKLTELNTFPLADAKKLDEAQKFTSGADYNQLVEVRKIEELQNLRSVQSSLAQTPTLRQNAANLTRTENTLTNSFDPSAIKVEDLGGRDDLVKTYERLSSAPRPINSGQFGAEATPGAQPAPVATPGSRDAVLTTCPEGAIFKQFEGCVWADSGKKINDYDQYKCDGPRQYYSFAVKKCVAYESDEGFKDDAQPICPIGYTWNWQTQSCQTSTGGILPFPTPTPEIEIASEEDIERRNKSCPQGSSYQPPKGCTWDDSGKSVFESEQYRCSRGQYYSFETHKCVTSPKEGQPYPGDSSPDCKEDGTYWSWQEGKCVLAATVAAPSGPIPTRPVTIDEIKPANLIPGNPFYFIKQATETLQKTFAFTPKAREQVSLAQAKARLAEAAAALQKDDEKGVKTALSSYTSTMQNLVGDLSKESLAEGAKVEIGKILKEQSAEHNLLLQKLSTWAGAKQDNDINAAVSATILGVDKAADIAGEAAIPDEIKSKIEALPEKMISEEDKKALLETNSRVEARLKLGGVIATGGLTAKDTDFLNTDFNVIDKEAQIRIEELKKLEQIAETSLKKDETEKTISENEQIVEKLAEFEKSFEPGKDAPTDIPADVRPYVKLTRINEVAQTIRPDIVRLEDFANRKDVILAVATLQEEFRPTKESFQQVADFRRRNPGTNLPPDLARIEALSYSLGVRNQASSCFLPTPPFPANTPCPAPGAAVPIASYYTDNSANPFSRFTQLYSPLPSTPSVDKDGKALVYGQGPKAETAGSCPDGYHWMYDSGGWCMSNSGNYSNSYNYTPTGTGSGYTPYSPYYTAPGAPPASFGYPGGNYNSNPGYSYGAPSYYGTAPTYYTTNPPAGTVPGSGPKPTSPGNCPSGFHWMSDSGGWCMSDGPTYVPGGATTTSSTPPPGGYNCGSQPYDPSTGKCKDGACPGGFNWDGSKCVTGPTGGYPYGNNYSQSTSCGPGYYWNGQGCVRTSTSDTYGSCQPPASGCGPGLSWEYGSCSCRGYVPSYGGGYSPSSYQSGCTPGYYWNGSKCVAGSNEGGSWSDSAARTQSWCQPPSSGCGTSSYWDYSSCSCRGSNTYYGSSSGSSCSPPAGGCGSGWFDSSSCSCKQASSQGCYNVSASSCGSGFYWDAGACTCRQSSTSTPTSSSGTTTSGGSSSGSCPGGYHWMSDNGGWCMSDAARDSASSTPTSGSTTSPQSTPAPTTTTESAPAPATEPTPAAPATEPAPAPAAPAPASEPAPTPAP